MFVSTWYKESAEVNLGVCLELDGQVSPIICCICVKHLILGHGYGLGTLDTSLGQKHVIV